MAQIMVFEPDDIEVRLVFVADFKEAIEILTAMITRGETLKN